MNQRYWTFKGLKHILAEQGPIYRGVRWSLCPEALRGLATTAGKEEADGRKKLSCGWADLFRDSLSPPSVVMPELQELLTPEGPSWSLRKGLCVSCPARRTHGEKVGKERIKVKGTISSFSRGLQKVVRKAGEYEIRVQESQRWWGSTKDGQKRSELSFQNWFPVPAGGGTLPQGELVQAL